MQVEDLIYQKKLFFATRWDCQETRISVYRRMRIPQSNNTRFKLTFTVIICCFIMNEKTIVDLMSALIRMYMKTSASNKTFLMKRIFNMKIINESSIIGHLNNFNTMMNQLCSLGIKFDEKVSALLLLSSFP